MWIGRAGEGPERAIYTPPPADQLLHGLSALLKDWNAKYTELERAAEPTKIAALARFHHAFVSLHPFLDGNGRVARILLSQQVLDLFGPRDAVTFDQGAVYYTALQNADRKDYSLLEELLSRAVRL